MLGQIFQSIENMDAKLTGLTQRVERNAAALEKLALTDPVIITKLDDIYKRLG